MFYRILYTLLLVSFVSACSTTSKDTADSSGSGSSGEFNTATTSEGEASTSSAIDTTTSDFSGIIRGTQKDLIVSVGDRVFFDYDSAELNGDAKELLQAQAAWLKQYNKTSVIIEGHCDERGTREYNLALGERRAQAVKNYLNGLGVSTSSMSTISYGKERPAVVGSNDDAWSQNRRSVTKVN